MPPTVSVVIPVYNAEDYIERCLDSVFNQSFNDIEIIAVDDGSTDRSLELLNRREGKIQILSQENRGAAAARNTGIVRSTGTYVAFLDSDDLWHPRKLEIQIKTMVNHPSLAACYTKYQTDRSHSVPNPCALNEPGIAYKNIQDVFRFPYMATSSILVTRTILTQIQGFDEALKTAEDVDLILKIANKGPVGEIRLELVTLSRREDSLGNSPTSYSDNLFVVDRFIQESNSLKESGELISEVKAKIYYDWAKDLAWHGHTAESILRSTQHLRYSRTLKYLPSIGRFVGRSMFRRKNLKLLSAEGKHA